MHTHRVSRVPEQAASLLDTLTFLSAAFLLLYIFLGRGMMIDVVSVEQVRSRSFIKAVRSGLDAYREKFGTYPEAENPHLTVTIDGKTYPIGEATCLYQALSGDGFDQIKGRTRPSPAASNGRVDTVEAKDIVLENMPKEMWTESNGIYYLVDGYGHPIRSSIWQN